ncbi:MAG TPA: PAS domain S-box protein [Rubrivivax sp.]|nr:PAS domain S-box protein [Rubrivivax sp.]
MTTAHAAAAAGGGNAGESGDTLLYALFDAYLDALLLVGHDGRIVRANPAAHPLLGYTQAELVGMEVDALVPQAMRAQHATFRQRYGEAPRARPMGTQMELVALRKDGSEVLVEIALSPLQGQGRSYVVAAIRDIAAYPRVQQALQRARYSEHLAQFGRLAVDAREPRVLLDQVPAIAAEALRADAVHVYLLDANGAGFALAGGAGLLDGEALGMRVPNHPDTVPGRVMQLGRALTLAAAEPDAGTAGVKMPAAWQAAGMRTLLAVPLSDRGRTVGALAACSRLLPRFGADELRFLESLSNLLATCLQRAQSEDALQHALRLESVGQLTGGIAHDFNNLLTVIQGNLQVLEELPALAGDGHGRQLLAAALRASRRGAELTGKLLAFSRRQVLQPSALDVAQLLQSLAGMLRRTLDQRIRIEVDVAPSCPPVLADPGQLEAALLNIAINARDAMREGGRLRFAALPCAALPAGLRDSLDDPSAREQGFVAIAIGDSGSGMSDEVKQRAFEPFFTTKEAGRGTGLGLSTVYGFVKQSRGALTLDSAPGAGTTLTLYLPRPGSAANEREGPAEPPHTLPAGLKVLLVEDDAEVREVVRAFLLALDCRVTQAASGEQALLELGPGADFDLLLSDIALGAGMRGTRLAALAQQRLPRLAVLLMSGYSAELLDADRDAPLAWELLHKPYSRDELAAAMARLMAARAE